MTDPCNHQDMLARLSELEEDLSRIKERNAMVEGEKAWELSSTRKISIVIFTYFITSLVFWLISVPRPLMNAFIPTVGYFLSTLSLPIVKRRWISKYTELS